MICIFAVAVQGKWKLNDISSSSSSHAHTSLNWLSVSVYHRTNLTLEPLEYTKKKQQRKTPRFNQLKYIKSNECTGHTKSQCFVQLAQCLLRLESELRIEIRASNENMKRKKKIHNEKITHNSQNNTLGIERNTTWFVLSYWSTQRLNLN